MAGNGPPPKPPSQRRRRNAEPARKTIDRSKTSPKKPALPRAGQYLPETLAWYSTWSTSPQAVWFVATDWQRLHMLAPLVDAYWREPTKELMAEIRLNEAKLGATEDDRRRLRWDLPSTTTPSVAKPPSGKEAPKAPAMADRRAAAKARLSGSA